ncbi:MAG: hypothetical protein V4675_12005 [Verrucomicrobiota bacterium]
MGPEGGSSGGQVLGEGPPEIIAACLASSTGYYLKSRLHPKARPGTRLAAIPWPYGEHPRPAGCFRSPAGNLKITGGAAL